MSVTIQQSQVIGETLRESVRNGMHHACYMPRENYFGGNTVWESGNITSLTWD